MVGLTRLTVKIKPLGTHSKVLSPVLAILILLTVAIGIYVVGHGHAANNSPDVNSDGVVNITDLSILLTHYGTAATAAQGDLNGDGTITITDLSMLLSAWGTHPASNLVSVPFRINAGGPAYTDTSGNVWAADQYAADGSVDSQGAGQPIAGTTDDALYQDERYAMTGYHIPVANGTYRVRLHFAEINPPCQQAGCRIQSVTAEGNAFVTNLDVYQKVGGYTADIEEGLVTVTGNSLDLGFSASANAAAIDAIEILPSSTTPLPTATPTPAPTPGGNSPSGQTMPTGSITSGGHTWTQSFTDDFTTSVATGSFPGSSYSNKWTVYDEGWPDTSHNGQQCPNEVLSVTGGTLQWHLFTPAGAKPCVADPEPANNQTYGRYSVRMKADSVDGWAIAYLLWPDSNIWGDGETDWPEGVMSGTSGVNGHATGSNPANNVFQADSGLGFTGWHTYTTEWEPNKINYYIDNTLLGTQTTYIPTVSRHWVLQVDTAYGAIPAPSATANITVDWVSIWSY